MSSGKCGNDSALDKRHWIYLTVKPSPESFNMRIEKPSGTPHSGLKPLGIALTREETLADSMREHFFAVADYIVSEDPAGNSHLMGLPVIIGGRVCKH